MEKSAFPTRKWLAARVTAIAGIVVLAITTEGWNTEEWVATVTFVAEALVGYLTPNEANTPKGDGVPAKSGS